MVFRENCFESRRCANFATALNCAYSQYDINAASERFYPFLSSFRFRTAKFEARTNVSHQPFPYMMTVSVTNRKNINKCVCICVGCINSDGSKYLWRKH